ncbi:cyclic nucleotide-binding domain-containing protein [Geminocystis herdmanii]|uniref:cyclic nucleotide-binding domain-containing protein n=1 Tax=Geminocystis herdmanii TaxID=669359 RepID=UPI00034CC861|nr:cyclic nucleotide-binding domain-containing protein [Geminocystis herdmanii]
MVYTVSTVGEFISTIEPFKNLSPNTIQEISAQFQPLKYDMGQIMLVKEKIPPYIAIIYEGQARCIAYDPRNSTPVSVQLISNGSVIGWESLIRGFPCETAIASTPVVALTLERDKFLDLLKKHPSLKEYYQNQVGLIEIFELLGQQLLQRATGEGNLKELVKDTIIDSQVCNLSAGKARQ